MRNKEKENKGMCASNSSSQKTQFTTSCAVRLTAEELCASERLFLKYVQERGKLEFKLDHIWDISVR